ncbi:MAG: hypothetical protein SFY69_05790 [Planctomycetota bacterium]|nr:hypothetical protein [Planctomycetota bacterium]
MNIQELLENAHLDALGLLDPEERAAFDLAFLRAPEGVKAHVRAEQARVAVSPALLADASPPPALREKVLAGVRAAMLEAEVRAVEDEPLVSRRRVAPWWRPTAIGMLTAAALLGAAFVSVYFENAKLRQEVASSAVMNDLMGMRLGAGVLDDTLFSPDTRRIVFEATDQARTAEFPGRAAVYVNPRWEDARFFCADLPTAPGASYRLVTLTADNRIAGEVAELPAEKAITTRGLGELASGTRLAIIRVGEGGVFDAAADILLIATV